MFDLNKAVLGLESLGWEVDQPKSRGPETAAFFRKATPAGEMVWSVRVTPESLFVATVEVLSGGSEVNCWTDLYAEPVRSVIRASYQWFVDAGQAESASVEPVALFSGRNGVEGP